MKRFACPVRLKPSSAGEEPSLWICGRVEFEGWLLQADARIVEELEFAQLPDQRTILKLRRGGKSVTLAIPGSQSFATILRLSNAYHPTESRLVPLVRRDRLREIFEPSDRIFWVAADGRSIQVESLPGDAFQPLSEWVEYLAPSDRRREVASWPESFPFGEFLEPAEKRVVPKNEPEQELIPDENQDLSFFAKLKKLILPKKGVAPPKVEPLPERPTGQDFESLPPSEAFERLQAIQTDFFRAEGTFDCPSRRESWVRLFEGFLATEQADDAAIAWSNARWYDHADLDWSRVCRAERADATEQELRQIAATKTPKVDDLRRIVVWLIDLSRRKPKPTSDRDLLPKIAECLRDQELRLPVRIAWFGWLALARWSDGDLLMLSRAADRLLADLLENGLRSDRDLPQFLRTGLPQSQKLIVDAKSFLSLRDEAWAWCGGHHTMIEDGRHQKAFVDLTFAYALARFGDIHSADRLRNAVATEFEARPISKALADRRWILDAYLQRVRRMISGESPTQRLSDESRRELSKLNPAQRTNAERFLKFSRILEPFDRVDPFRNQRNRVDDLEETLLQLATLGSPRRRAEKTIEQIQTTLRDLLKANRDPGRTFRILCHAIPLSLRVGESFAVEILPQIAPTMAQLPRWLDIPDLTERVQLLETSLVVSAHFGRTMHYDPLIQQIHLLLKPLQGEVAAWLVAALGGGNFRFLAKLGLRDQSDVLLQKMSDAVTGGDSIVKLLRRPGLNRAVFLPALLKLAGGWYSFNRVEDAGRVLDASREELFQGTMGAEPRITLATAYASTLGHAEPREALAGYRELFERLPISYLTFEQGTIHRLRVIEAVTLTMASDNFSADPRTRRWLDEDEFAVRQRIHRDLDGLRRTSSGQ